MMWSVSSPALLVPIRARLNVLSANWPTRRWQRTNETENKVGLAQKRTRPGRVRPPQLAASFISGPGTVSGHRACVKYSGPLAAPFARHPTPQPLRRRIGNRSRGLRSATQNNIVRSTDKSLNVLTNGLRPALIPRHELTPLRANRRCRDSPLTGHVVDMPKSTRLTHGRHFASAPFSTALARSAGCGNIGSRNTISFAICELSQTLAVGIKYRPISQLY
jgi:hypothetical protein